MWYPQTPTVYPFEPFDCVEDGNALRSAMKGFGTDEQTIIDILTSRSNAQRQEIARYFEEDLGRDLIKDLKSELGGHFEDVIVALVLPPVEYLCKQIHKAMSGMGTNEDALIEIICSKTNDEVTELIDTYEKMYDKPLVAQVCSETSGDFRKLLTLILTCRRDASWDCDDDRARELAEELYNAGEGQFGTEESTFTRILAHENFVMLCHVFDHYKDISGNTIEQALRHELSGSHLESLLAIVECVQSPPAFFAKRLYKAMDGAGTDDCSLIRIIVSRSEIDLENIKQEFERIYDKTLYSFVSHETSGDYKKALLALIR